MRNQYLSLVAVLTLVTASGSLPSFSTESRAWAAQTLQKGISVQMPVTKSAVPMPDADKADALIVAVTAKGNTYLGIDPFDLAALADKIESTASRQPGRKLYLKADARASYVRVAKVLDTLHSAGVESAVLLTRQRESPNPGTRVPPMGLEVWIRSASSSGSNSAEVKVLRSGGRRPTLEVNNRRVEWAALQTTLKRLLQNQGGREVLVNVDGILPFSDAVAVADTARSAGAKVFLAAWLMTVETH